MIRKLNIKDKEEIKNVINVIYKTFLHYNNKDSSEKLKEKMKKLFGTEKVSKENLELFETSEIILISKSNATINGVIRGSRYKITNLYVAAETQGKGIGKKLLEKYCKEAKKLGSQNIYLKPSKYAYNFYIKQGFKIKSEIYLEKNI